MPWAASEAKSHTQKANTPAKQKRWAKIANAALKEKGDDAYAIRTANSAMDSRFWDGITFRDSQFKIYVKTQDKKLKAATKDDDNEEMEDDFGGTNDDMVTCPECDGSGTDEDGDVCETCDGTGFIEDDDEEESDRDPNDPDSPDDLPDDTASAYGDAYKKPWTHATCDKDWTVKQRKAAVDSGEAMANGGFPIKTKADVAKAAKTLDRAANRAAAVAHISKRAKALDVKLADGWSDKPTARDVRTVVVGGGRGSPVESTVRMYDTITIDDAAKVRDLEGGYLAAMPRIARTGIQVYHGSECGRDDMDVVRVYRPEDSVFHKDSVHSYTHLPVTLDHPPVSVTAANWKQYSVGETGEDVLRDGGSVRVPMMLRDANAINAFRKGKNQLSVGYDCDLEWTSGVTDSGEKYDAIQRGIRANHLAVVAAARGGSTLKIGDDDSQLKLNLNDGDYKMNLRTVLVDGLEVQVVDTAAPVIQRTLGNYEQQLQDARQKLKTKDEEAEERDTELAKKDTAIKAKDADIKAKDKTIETKDGEIAALKKQLEDEKAKSSPAAIDAASRERADVVVKAQKLLNGNLKVDGMSVPDIRRAVVDARIGNCKDWSDDRVSGAFDAMQASDRTVTHHSRNDVNDAVTVFGRPGGGYMSPQQIRDQAYNDYDKDRSEAWRNAPKN